MAWRGWVLGLALAFAPAAAQMADRTAIYDATDHNATVLLAQLLEAHPDLANTADGAHALPLYTAVEAGKLKAAAVLLDRGADPNATDADHCVALLAAAHSGRIRIAKLLLAHKANPNAFCANGETPLHEAISEDKLDVAALLIAHHAGVNARNDLGWTPLFEVRSATAAKILLKAGADPNAREETWGTTVLHAAAENDDVALAVVLVAFGADVNAPDKEGHTPLYAARNMLHEEQSTDQVEAFLLRHGAHD